MKNPLHRYGWKNCWLDLHNGKAERTSNLKFLTPFVIACSETPSLQPPRSHKIVFLVKMWAIIQIKNDGIHLDYNAGQEKWS